MGKIKDFFSKLTGGSNVPRLPQQSVQNQTDALQVQGEENQWILDYTYKHPRQNLREKIDTVRLIINKTDNTFRVEGEQRVTEARISWYSSSDAQVFVEQEDGSIKLYSQRRDSMTDICIGNLDFHKMSYDPAYQEMLFEHLLDRDRVNERLKGALNGIKPCGNYVGEVEYDPKTGGYKKTDRLQVGKIIHSSQNFQNMKNKYLAAERAKARMEERERRAQEAINKGVQEAARIRGER